MITIQKIKNEFYLRVFSVDTTEFNSILLVVKSYNLKYVTGKGSTSSNPKILLDVLHELSDNFETFVSEKIVKEIDDFNPYVPSFSPKRISLDMSYFEKFPPKGQFQIDDVYKMVCYGHVLNANKMGLGKAQPNSSKVLTNLGWKTIGEIKVGDQVVTEQGTFAPVTNIFPQGEKEIFELTFNDYSTARCTEDHLWAYQTHNDLFHKKEKYRVAPLKDFINKKIKEGTVVIPTVKSIQFEEKALPIDPWFMGALLGNGCFCGSGHITFSTTKPYIINKVESLLKDTNLQLVPYSHNNFGISIIANSGAKGNNFILNAIRDYDLLGKGSKEKHIPKDYLFSSVEQRLALLTGLIDTDGYVDKTGYVLHYYTSSPQLRDDVLFLIQSLGGLAIIASKTPFIGEKEYSTAYSFTLKMPEDVIPISIPEKLVRFRPKTKYPPRRVLRKIEPCGVEESTCIAVDSPNHLYLTDNCIVTHNTYESIQTLNQLISKNLADRILIVTIASTLYNWQYEILNFSDLFTAEDILIITEANREVFHTKQLPKIVIVSYNTFRLCSDYIWKLDNPYKPLKEKLTKVQEKELQSLCKAKKIKFKEQSPEQLEKLNKKLYLEKQSNYRNTQIDFSDWGTSRILITDECHNLNHMDTRWTQIVHKEKKYFNYIYPLSGTPSPNGIQELYSPLKLLDDNLVDEEYVNFLHSIGDVGTSFSQFELASIDEAKAKKLYDRIKPYVIRRFLRDHIDLPQVERKNIYIPFEGIQKQIYQTIVNNTITAIKEEKGVVTYKDIQVKFPYIFQALSDPLLIKDKILELGYTTVNFCSTIKFVALKTLLEDLTSKKIVVWGIHPQTLDRLAEEFKDYKCMIIHGQNTPKGQEKNKWRDDQVRDFKTNDSRILFANPSVLGTGVNISFANTLIHYDRDFNYTIHEQSDGRMERIGLAEDAEIYNLIIVDSLEIFLEKALENKKIVDTLFLSSGLTQKEVKSIFNP